MKKVFVIFLSLSIILLSACTSAEVGCGNGTELIDGVCTPINNDDDDDDNNDPFDVTCETSLSDYTNEDYTLAWSDEFDYEGRLDTEKWLYQTGNGGKYALPGWGNNEAQYYSASLDNVSVGDGLLKITAMTDGYAQYDYTSGRVRTKGNADFLYGIVEVCAMMPEGLGTWPAIWMLPTDSPHGGWPQSGELDIMEAVGFETQGIVHGSIHTDTHNWGNGGKSLGDKISLPTISTEFHKYAMKWTENTITYYVDGLEYYTWTTPNQYDPDHWPFDTEFHILLNIAVGGTWGGQRGIQDGEWETSMYVDYVRVYQVEEEE